MRECFHIAALVVLLLPAPSVAQATDESARPLESFHDLALRVQLGHQVRIEDNSGVRITGRLTRLSPDEIAIEAEGGERLVASRDVRVVSRRQGSILRGALIGAGSLAALGAISECRGGKNHYCGEGLGMGLIFGAGLGGCAGSFFPRLTTVYRAPKRQASLSPVLSRHAVGVRVGLSW